MDNVQRFQPQIPAESARSIQIEMRYSQDGPDADDNSEYRGQAWGSAFLYEVDGKTVIVTARHNVTGRHWQTGKWLCEYPTAPTHLRIAFLPKPETPSGWEIKPSGDDPERPQMIMALPLYSIPLLDENWKPTWLQHPRLGPAMDVAVIPFEDTLGHAFINTWTPPAANQSPERIAWPQLTAGQDAFIIGHPKGLATGPLLPLWMRGTIASEPMLGHHVDGHSLPIMVIDARTREGSSGSAVIRHRADGTLSRKPDGSYGVTIGSHSEILGVYSGRTHDDSDLGFVWRIEEVDVICRDGVQGTNDVWTP